MLFYIAEVFAEHPFLLTAAGCILCMTLTTGVEISLLSALVPMLVLCFGGIFGAVYITNKSAAKSKKTLMTVLCVISVLFSLIFGHLLMVSAKPQLVVLSAGIIFLAAAAVYLFAADSLNTKRAVFLLFALGFLMRFAYIMTIDIHHKQHDVGSIEDMNGHLGYIGYIVYNLGLPDIDVRTVYQYYHPPLHHIIAALWVRLQNALGIPQEYVWENIQILTLFYSCCCMILCYKIFKQLGLKGNPLVAAMAIIAFNPTFYILSGSINNDILSITFILGAILNTLYWYKSRSFGRIMCISLCVGFGMMTKLSVWMVAPAIAFVFIYVFFKDIRNFKKYIAQFAAFLAVCVPLALWWGIRNAVTYQVPITYVPMLSETSQQYIGDISVTKRLFDFSPYQLAKVGDQFLFYEGEYNEFNPLIALFKTSAFDELFTSVYYPQVNGWDKLLFWTVVLVGIVGFAAMIYTFIKDKSMELVHKIFFGVIYAVFFVSYYIFCIQFPHVCTENIRYAVPLIVTGAFFFGKALQLLSEKQKEDSKIVRGAIEVCMLFIVSIYSCSSVLFYYLIFMH